MKHYLVQPSLTVLELHIRTYELSVTSHNPLLAP